MTDRNSAVHDADDENPCMGAAITCDVCGAQYSRLISLTCLRCGAVLMKSGCDGCGGKCMHARSSGGKRTADSR